MKIKQNATKSPMKISNPSQGGTTGTPFETYEPRSQPYWQKQLIPRPQIIGIYTQEITHNFIVDIVHFGFAQIQGDATNSFKIKPFQNVLQHWIKN